MSRKCPLCGGLEKQHARFCSECGADLLPTDLPTREAAHLSEYDDYTEGEFTELPPLAPSGLCSPAAGCEIVVEVEVNRRHLLEHASLFRLRVTNNMTQPCGISIRMQLNGWGRLVVQEEQDIHQYCHFKGRGNQYEFSFPFRPLAAGRIRVDQLHIVVMRPERREKELVYELPDQSLFVDVSDPRVAGDAAGVAISGGIHIDLSQLQEMYGADIKNLLNVPQPATADKDAVAAAWEPIRLCVSEPRTKESPTLCHASFCPMSSGVLRFERTGQRIILVPRQRASLGRARDNDIVLRFLPRSPSFDTMSRNISRKHLEFELTDSGLMLRDQDSSTGTTLDGQMLRELVVSADRAGSTMNLAIGGSENNCDAFHVNLDLFRGEASAGACQDPRRDDQQISDLLQVGVSEIWEVARRCRINAARVARVSNVMKESYVLLFREAAIGSSDKLCPIALGDPAAPELCARIIYAKDAFWLDTWLGRGFVRVNGRPIFDRELMPLGPQTRLEFGDTVAVFEAARQLYL